MNDFSNLNYSELTKKCLELQKEIQDLHNTIRYYKESIEAYKKAYNTVNQQLKQNGQK